MRRWVRSAAVGCVRLYQRSLSRILPPTCRFRPSCSEYAIQAIERHGLLWGLLLALWRILRCNPFCAGGDDPVPDNRTLPGPRRKPPRSSSRPDELKAP